MQNDFLTNLTRKPSVYQKPTTPAPKPAISGPIGDAANAINNAANQDTGAATTFFPQLTPEEQTAKYGGPVGSEAYNKTKMNDMGVRIDPATGAAQFKKVDPYGNVTYTDQPNHLDASTIIPQTFGMRLPPDEVWDRMSIGDKIATVGKSATYAGVRLVTSLPRVLGQAGEDIIANTRALVDTAGGLSKEQINKNTQSLGLPKSIGTGEVTNFYQNYDDAIKAGAPPLLAGVMTAGKVAGDVTMLESLFSGLRSSLRPKAPIVEGEPVSTIKPVQNVQIETPTGGLKNIPKPPESPNEYYSLPKTVAKDNGGSTSNTFIKLSPAGEGATEVSIVRLRNNSLPNLIPNTISYVKNKLGIPETISTGDFGPEMKLSSQIIETNNPAKEAKASSLPGSIPAEEPVPQQILGGVPERPLKGFEKAPISPSQIETIQQIGKYNSIDEGMQKAVIKTITGKEAIGDMTQSDFVKVAQVLAKMNDLAKYAPDASGMGVFSGFLKPFRPPKDWMGDIETNTGIPLYSQVYDRLEKAFQTKNLFTEAKMNQAREIFGDQVGNAENRRLIFSYMEGDTGAILNNPTLTPEIKTQLVGIADKMRVMYNELGNTFGIPTDVFLKDYQPHIQNINGIYQLYKEGSMIPKNKEFFAEYKRTGNIGTKVDDALALFDIYTQAGANKTFLNPALEGISDLHNTLPATLKGSVGNYVKEKLGYADTLEKLVNDLVPSINKKLGINLPADTARQMTNIGLSSAYGGLLSQPATWFRQTFQYPLFGYARLGPNFLVDAVKKGISKAGMEEARKAGVLLDVGDPYGQSLIKDVSLGGKAVNTYMKGTQMMVKPISVVDNVGRSITFQHAKAIWNDALSKFNSGQIDWNGLEKGLGLKSFTPAQEQTIKQNLLQGDVKGAFQTYAREIIDEVNGDYGLAKGPAVTYGFTGKLTTALQKYPLSMTNTLAKWTREGVTTGDFSKLIRFWGAASAMQRTLKDSFGFDFTKNLTNVVPINSVLSPFADLAASGVNMITNSSYMKNNAQTYNENKQAILKTLSAMNPLNLGVEGQNIAKFRASLAAGQDKDGYYTVYGGNKKPAYKTDFAGLFWGVLMGFPTEDKVNSQNLQTNMINASYNRDLVRTQILQLLQQKRVDEAKALMQQTGIRVTPESLKSYYVPQNVTTFLNLPPDLKDNFVDQIKQLKK